MDDSTVKGLEPEAGKRSQLSNSDTIAHGKGFLPLLDDIPQQRQKKSVATNESFAPRAQRTLSKKRLDLETGGHAKGFTFLPLLPTVGTDCPKQGIPNNGPNAIFVSPAAPSASTLNTKQPSHGHFADATTFENNERSIQSKPARRYEWPLIVNGVYQGEEPIPSCRIEDNESPTEPEPYAWPLIILHRARSAEICDQQPGPNAEEANENPAERERKVEESRINDKERTDDQMSLDGTSAEC